jgi:serine-type D-Ala-D-Ala carboxypeptidase (penicillin-binding protein 5/6)
MIPLPKSNQKTIDNRRLINLALVLVLMLSLFALVSLSVNHTKIAHDTNNLAKTKINPFDKTNILAKSAIVYDIAAKKILYSKNPDEVLPLASITKILTAVTAVEILPKNTVVTVRKAFLDETGDSGLYRDEKWKLSDLINFSLVVSSNDGAAAIAGAAGAFVTKQDPSNITMDQFVTMMNAKAKEIGMNTAKFYNANGLDVSTSLSGGYGSVRDIATLFAYALENHPEITDATRYDQLSFVSNSDKFHTAINTDKDINEIPGLLVSKTGYTDLAGGNLGIVFDPGIGRPIAVVVLGSTYDGRFSDVSELVKETDQYIAEGN